MTRRGRKRKKRRDRRLRAGRPGRGPAPAGPGQRAPAEGPGGFPVRPRLAWQVAVRPVPEWRIGSAGEGRAYETPLMPWGVICIPAGRGSFSVHVHDPEGPPPGPDDVLALLEAVAEQQEAWPGVLEVEDPVLAEVLADRFGEAGIEVALRERLRHVDHYQQKRAIEEGRMMLEPSLATAPGVTDDLLRGFHEAWVALAERPLGSLLENRDLLHVEAPSLAEGSAPAWCLIGRRRGPFVDGLRFAERAEDAARLGRIESPRPGGPESPWFVELSPVAHQSIADYGAWRRLGLGTIGPERWVPRAWCLARRRLRAPDGPLLAWFEAVLRGLAATRREDLEAGAWEATVETSTGSVTCRFSVRSFAALRGETQDVSPRLAEDDPRAYARTVALAARELSPARRWARAREALEHDPGCPEALFVLALAEEDRERRIEALRRALVAAHDRRREWLAEHGGGAPDREDERIGVFPLEPEVEQEMDPAEAVHVSILLQVAFTLAQELEVAGRFGEAADVLLGVTWFPGLAEMPAHLLRCAFEAGRADLVDAVLDTFGLPDARYPDGALWAWAEALYRFMAGEEELAEAWLGRARELAPEIGEGILLDLPGEKDEEDWHAAILLEAAWRAVPGARDWLFRRMEGIRRRDEGR